MRVFRAVMAVLLVCLAPLLSMAAAEFIAQVNGCKLDLASVHPCVVGGRDIGHALLTLSMTGYFLFATMPAVFFIVIAWVLIEVIAWLRRNSRASV